MAKVNFRQQKRQREDARKLRQNERMLRRGERPVTDADAATPAGAPLPAAPPSGQT